MNPLAIIEVAAQILAAVAKLVPEIEQNIGAVTSALSSTDLAALQTQIAQLHSDSQALTAQLDALKSK